MRSFFFNLIYFFVFGDYDVYIFAHFSHEVYKALRLCIKAHGRERGVKVGHEDFFRFNPFYMVVHLLVYNPSAVVGQDENIHIFRVLNCVVNAEAACYEHTFPVAFNQIFKSLTVIGASFKVCRRFKGFEKPAVKVRGNGVKGDIRKVILYLYALYGFDI